MPLPRTPAVMSLGRPTVLVGASRGLSQRTLLIPVRAHAALPSLPAADWLLPWLPAAVRDALPPPGPALPAPLAPVDLAARLCVALQVAAGQPVDAYRVRLTSQADVAELAVAIHVPDIALNALQCAVQTLSLRAAAQGGTAQDGALPVQPFLDEALRRAAVLPNTLAFLRSARRLSIPWRPVAAGIYQFGQGIHARRLKGAFTDATSAMATQMARHKPTASALLQQAGLPVPRQRLARSEQDCLAAAEQLGYPVVVKPADQDQGLGVSLNLRTPQAVREAHALASRHGPTVIVEQHVPGDDHRLLVMHGRLLAAARRRPASVTGDGRSTVQDLVARLNADPRRSTRSKSLLQHVALDNDALARLAEQGLAPESVPPAGQVVQLRQTANISTGGTAEDVLPIIHPDNAQLAVRAAQVIGLDIAGVDVLSPDISRPWHEVGGAICEVNSQPGFRPHWLAEPARDINGDILRLLFGGGDGRIPLATVTGSQSQAVGQTLHDLLVRLGRRAGWCSPHGLHIGSQAVQATPWHARHDAVQTLLGDQRVEAAVIDLPLAILREEGSPFDLCDAAALLDLPPATAQDMALQCADDLLQRARHAVVLDAMDPRCLALAIRLPAQRVILVADTPQHPVVAAHLARGHRAATWGGKQPALHQQATRHPLPPDAAPHDTWAAALAWALGESPALIAASLAPPAHPS